MKGKVIMPIIALGIMLGLSGAAMSQDYPSTMTAVAQDIERLKPHYPQLRDFSVEKHLNREALRIDYEFHTHEPARKGGWTSGVPHPNDDGIWFYIDLHDPDSMAQIHTQPVVGPPMCLGNKRVTFLILEGSKSKSISSALWKILRAHGTKECPM